MADLKKSRPLHLLLLPPCPRPVTYDSLKAAYETPITATLEQLTFEIRQESTRPIVEIAVPIPFLLSANTRPRAELFSKIQSIVAGVYKLICVTTAKKDIDIESQNGVDVRVLILAYEPKSEGEASISDQEGAQSSSTSQNLINPVVTVEALAQTQRPWNYVVTVEGEEGEELLRRFLTSQEERVKTNKVPGGIVHVDLNALDAMKMDEEEAGGDRVDHRSIATGGTFDHLHVGHKLLLTMSAFLLAASSQGNTETQRKLTVGITGDELLKKKKYAEFLESWDQRQQLVLEFLTAILDFRPSGSAGVESERKNEPGPNGHAVVSTLNDLVINCAELSDPYGPPIVEEPISAIVVTAETRGGGKAINDKRSEKGWAPLETFEVDLLDADESGSDDKVKESFEGKLSSTSIREQLSKRSNQGT